MIANVLYKELVSVPGGTFTQTDEYNTSFSHAISSFKMGKYEVTYELWYIVLHWAILPGHDYKFQNAGQEGRNGAAWAPTDAKHQPVVWINWRDVIVWCNAYSELQGLIPCYTYQGVVIKDSRNANASACDNAVCNWENNGYRLPTEGEWQYSASYIDGSSWTPYNYASGDNAACNTSANIGDYCWYITNSGMNTHDVGGKTANALGIYDMSGNVSEWCWDWIGLHPGFLTVDYRGATSGSTRAIRGGCYYAYANEVALEIGGRSYDRPPYSTVISIGFRLAMKQ
jgi:formylglycine-generating enzyme required for sulfatase activity